MIILGLGFFVLNNCEEAGEDQIGNALESELPGSWGITGFENIATVTSSSEQDVIQMFSPGVGGVNISGDLIATLSYLFVWDFSQYYAITIGNQLLGSNTFPIYTLAMTYSNESVTSFSLSVLLLDSVSYTFETDEINATYDPVTLTVEIASIALMDVDSSKSITIDGQLQMKRTHIPVGEPTIFNFYEGMAAPAPGSGIYVFADDLTFQYISNTSYGGQVYQDTTTGSWSLNGDRLTMVNNLPDGEVGDPWVVSVDLEGNELILTQVVDCNDSSSKSNCLNDKENFYGLSPESLTEFSEETTHWMTRL